MMALFIYFIFLKKHRFGKTAFTIIYNCVSFL